MGRALALTNAVNGQRDRGPMLRGDVQQDQIVAYLDVNPRYWSSIEDISRLARMPPNWDTYGSVPIRRSAIKAAFDLLKLIEAEGLEPPCIGPVSGGGLQFEWNLPTRELELEILPDGSVDYLRIEDDGNLKEGMLPPASSLGVRDEVRWFHRT